MLTTRLQGQGGALNRPVSVGGVPILPGDAILADGLGVVAIHADELPTVLARADALLELTTRTIAGGVETGAPIGQLSGASDIVTAPCLRGERWRGISDHVDAAFAACPAGALGFVYDYSTAKFSTDPAKFTLPEVIEARGGGREIGCGLVRFGPLSCRPSTTACGGNLSTVSVELPPQRALAHCQGFGPRRGPRGLRAPARVASCARDDGSAASAQLRVCDGHGVYAGGHTFGHCSGEFCAGGLPLQDRLSADLPRHRNSLLSPREAECLALTAEGLSAKQIAYALGRSESMVVKHLQAAGGKLGARNRSHAVALATRHGWIT